MIKKLFISIGLAFSLLLPAVYAQAQARVAVVNIDRILSEARMAQASQTKLEQEFSARQAALEAEAKKLEEMIAAYQRDLVTLSESARNQREAALRTADENFTRTSNEFQRDLNNRRAQELQALLERANAAVQRVATEGKFDLILSEAVYVNPTYDVTDKVLNILNNGR